MFLIVDRLIEKFHCQVSVSGAVLPSERLDQVSKNQSFLLAMICLSIVNLEHSTFIVSNVEKQNRVLGAVSVSSSDRKAASWQTWECTGERSATLSLVAEGGEEEDDDEGRVCAVIK